MAPCILNVSLKEWSVSCCSYFINAERVSSAHGAGGWVGFRAVQNILEKRKISAPARI
jgi:hypothetical protein